MNPHRVRAITRRLLSQFRHDRRTLALLFLAPLVILTLLGYVMRGGGDAPSTGVVDEDGGTVAREYAAQLLQSRSIRTQAMDRTEADHRLAAGSLDAYVVIPAAFAAAGAAATPEVHLEGSQPGPGATVQAAVVEAGQRLAARAPGALRVQPRVTYLHGGPQLDQLDYLGSALVGLIVFLLVFVITSISFLRERSQGTLERLMASPIRRSELVVGYMLAFTMVALVQGLVILTYSLLVLRIHNAGSVLLVFGFEALLALSAVNLGIFLSVFARTEFEAVQFIPLVLVPQVLLSGVIFPIYAEPRPLQVLSHVLPLTYGVYGMRDVMVKGDGVTSPGLLLDAAVLAAFCALCIALAGASIRRRVA
jgi:ABC-2 type transport system permease protein